MNNEFVPTVEHKPVTQRLHVVSRLKQRYVNNVIRLASSSHPDDEAIAKAHIVGIVELRNCKTTIHSF